MGLESWFRFETKKERKKREEKYFRKMFPMGAEQKEWEKTTMAKLFPHKKDTRPMLYDLLVLREILIKIDDPETDEEDRNLEEKVAVWEKHTILNKNDAVSRDLIKAMAFLEHRCTKMEELPDIEMIRSFRE